MLNKNYRLRIFESSGKLFSATADLIVDLSQKAIAQKGKFNLVLSGGNTPAKLYALLSEPAYSQKILWKNTFVFWGDERYVPFDDEQNNALMARKTLLSKVPIPEQN